MARKASRAPSKTYAQPSQNVMDFMLPKVNWAPISPSDWPDFSRSTDFLGVDTESFDPNLIKEGPGFIRGDAHVVGISLAQDEGDTIYLPIAQKGGGNYDPDNVKAYLKDQLKTDTKKCFANALYDVEAMWSLGIEIKGQWCDIQSAEPLIDEESVEGYSLDAIAKKYLGSGKVEGDLEMAASAFGVKTKGGLHHLHAKFVAEYAEADALMPIEIWQKQMKTISAEGLDRVLDIEMRLLPILWEMRRIGHRINVEYLEELDVKYTNHIKTRYEELYKITGRDLKYTSSGKVGLFMQEQGYRDIEENRYGPSVTNEWLQDREKEDGLCELLLDLRVSDKMQKDFVKKLLHARVGDRVHPSWIGQMSEDGGTKTGRMACKAPPLHQIPARSKHGPIIRAAFLPEEGKKFISHDYKAVEPRLAVEFSTKIRVDENGRYDKNGKPLEGAHEMLQTYIDDPKTDFHNAVQKIILEVAGIEMPRKDVKDIGLGALYNLGEKNMAIKMGISRDECKAVREAYFKGAPFIKGMIKCVEIQAGEVGYIKTLAGRRKRFNLFQPTSYEDKKRWGWNFTFSDEDEAKRELGTNYERAFIYRTANAMIQGSSADITKSAIIEIYEELNLVPLSAVHDEVNYSAEAELANRIRHLMETISATKFNTVMPFATDQKIADNWGQCK